MPEPSTAIYLGYLAGLGTSIAWSFTSVFFTLSGRLVGSAVVNRVRLLLAVVFVMLTHQLTQGELFPLGAEPFRWGWLALSGIIGYVIGDSFLFQAFVMIGARLSMLLMALAPVFSAAMAWVLFDETLAPRELAGMALVIGGVALVVSRRDDGLKTPDALMTPRRYAVGILCGLGAALGQAGGLVTSRQGLVGDFSALSGNLIRLTTAALAIWVLASITGKARSSVTALRANPRAIWVILGGAFAGPFIGVWLSLIAVQRAPLGIASTLMSLPPVILLPVSHFLFAERITRPAVLGTFLAFVGTAILFL